MRGAPEWEKEVGMGVELTDGGYMEGMARKNRQQQGVTNVRMEAYTHAHMYCMYTHAHTSYTHTHTIHTHAHTCTHTHTHTHARCTPVLW